MSPASQAPAPGSPSQVLAPESPSQVLAPGFAGRLESPLPQQRVARQAIAVRGWLVARGERVGGVVARVNGRDTWLQYRQPRPDIAALFPGEAAAGHSGFSGTVPAAPGAAHLEIAAVMEDGCRVPCLAASLIVPAERRPVAPLAFLTSACRHAAVAWREGRLDSPRRWLVHLRNLHRAMGTPGLATPASSAAEPAGSGDARLAHAEQCRGVLADFLATGARLDLRAPAEPEVSVLVVLHDRAELTLRCLRALAEVRHPTLEVVAVDNGSRDGTGALLDRITGLSILRNPENAGFVHGVNQAAALARGRALLLLNNDAELLPGSLASALRTLDSAPDIGAVGGRLIALDGRLQEAGSMVWRDGSCQGYGRGDDPRAPVYLHQRDVDYCSAALLLTPRELWTRMGGFDPDYAPAYYEDVDYCVRLWQAGRRVVYDPRAAALHYEFGSSDPARAVQAQAARRSLFVGKHRAWLARQPVAHPGHLLHARSARAAGPPILVLDDCVPREHHGSGQPRARDLISALVRLGWSVTLASLSFPTDRNEPLSELPPSVELLDAAGNGGLAALLAERQDFYRCILVSRPHNLARLAAARASLGRPLSVPLVYDSEAIFVEREISARRLHGEAIPPEAADGMRTRELALARDAAAVLVVSARDRATLSRLGLGPTFAVGHVLDAAPGAPPFAARAGLLFVGSLDEEGSPNVDAVRWFVLEVLPRLHRLLGTAVPFDVVGATSLPSLLGLSGPSVRLLGRVADLTGPYARARVFVAPTRFAAGLPYKVHHAAAHGVPAVATGLLAEQLGWQDGRDLLVAEHPEAFARACARLYQDEELWHGIRGAALARVAEDCSRQRFEAELAAALRAATGLAPAARECIVPPLPHHRAAAEAAAEIVGDTSG